MKKSQQQCSKKLAMRRRRKKEPNVTSTLGYAFTKTEGKKLLSSFWDRWR